MQPPPASSSPGRRLQPPGVEPTAGNSGAAIGKRITITIEYGQRGRLRGDAGADPAAADARINVLLTGIDSGHDREHALTDTLMVVSVGSQDRFDGD